MVNYQLYHTNIGLGGQMKYDLILDNVNGDVIINEFHISPISPRIPFNKYFINRDLLEYNHQDNIALYYKNINDNFYNIKEDPKMVGDNALILDNPGDKFLYNDVYEMGCRRMQYGIYGKQFGFFCPMWLEHIKDNEYIRFVFKLLSKSAKSNESESPVVIFSKNIDFNIKNIDIHDKFVNYFNDFFKNIGIKGSGSDNLLYIDKNSSEIHGINIKTGSVQSNNINVYKDLLIFNQPLIENDNLILSAFKNNNIIAKQLINFNLCFNIEDIINDELLDSLIGKQLMIQVDIELVGDEIKQLEKRDFYSNYDHIDRKLVNNPEIKYIKFDNKLNIEYNEQEYNPRNVLSYLQDNNCVLYTTKNKITQNIIHWSLCDNNNYIFNMYPGFEGYYINNNGDISNIPYKYMGAPDLLQDKYSPSLNNTGWCNIINFKPTPGKPSCINEFIDYQSHIISLHGSDIVCGGSGICWVNNIKYSTEYEGHIKMLLVYDESGIGFNNKIRESGEFIRINDNTIIYKLTGVDVNYISVWSNDINNLTYKGFIDICEGYLKNKDNEVLNNILSIFKTPINPIYIKPSFNINMILSPSPMVGSTEVTYLYNFHSQGQMVERYLGNIKPTFVERDMYNNFYIKPILTPDEYKKTDLYKFRKSRFNLLFPSINYYILKNCGKLDYKNINKDIDITSKPEYHWYDINSIYYLIPKFNVSLKSEVVDDEYESLNNLVRNWIGKYYDINNKEVLDYISSLYSYKCSYEYDKIDDNNKHNYIYNTEISLK